MCGVNLLIYVDDRLSARKNIFFRVCKLEIYPVVSKLMDDLVYFVKLQTFTPRGYTVWRLVPVRALDKLCRN